MSMATLYQIGQDGSRQARCEINHAPVLVGRSGRAQVNIEDDGVSRQHFLIVRDGEHFLIKDLNSRNGTWVGGNRVFADRLHHDDRILAGRTEFVFADPTERARQAAARLAGPHGTRIASFAPAPERDYTISAPWLEERLGNGTTG